MRAGFLTALLFGGAVGGAVPAHAALVISGAATSNVTCAAGVCSATAADAVLNVKDLKNLLQKADLQIVSGSVAQDIEVDVTFKWTKPFCLTLDSYRSITFKMPVTAEGTGAVTLTTNDGGTGGGLAFSGKGKLTFWDTTSSLVIGGHTYKLVSDIKTLAAAIATQPSGNYALAKAYDASVDRTYRDAPIQTTFQGKFDGLGHAIGNLTIKSPKTIALFEIGSSGIVSDLVLNNLHYSAAKSVSIINDVGGLSALNNGRIADITILGGDIETEHGSRVGGAIGESSGTVLRVSVDGMTIHTGPGTAAGGVVGSNHGVIVQSHANTSVFAGSSSWAGGLVGSNDGSISLSYAIGSASAKSPRQARSLSEGAGGLVGTSGGSIDQSFAIETVSGGSSESGSEDYATTAFAGGLVALGAGAISNSYAQGEATAYFYGGKGIWVGGLIGEEDGSVQNVYSTVKVDWSCGQYPTDSGGVFGYDRFSTNQSAYWDLDTSSVDDPHCGAGEPRDDPGITGLTDAQLKSGLPSGFDPAIWAQSASINNGYPYLIANPPPQ